MEELNEGLTNETNIFIFNDFVRTEYLASLCMAEYDLEKAKKAIHQKLKDNSRRRRTIFFKKITLRGSILLILGLAFFQWTERDLPVEIPESIQVGSDKAILTLGNGEQVALEKDKKYQTGIVNSNGAELVYAVGNGVNYAETIAYNYLTIPRGGQFMVKLSDGTKVWLNSDSELKYPVKFQKGMVRQVELVYGEAYFDVSPSANHQGTSFEVITESQIVKVLGTQFNIKAYKEDEVVETTLVEGEVNIQNGNVKRIIKPNQQSRIRKDIKEIEVVEIESSQEISWMNGLFAFNEESLDEIMKVLSRWYDVDIVFELAKNKEFVFTGILEKTKSIHDILNLIEATSEEEVKFETRNKTIIIKK